MIIFGVVYSAIFLAEIGDKTMLAVMILSARFRNPLLVALAASLALSTVTFLGAYAGKLVADHVNFDIVHKAAGVMFIAIGIVMLIWKK